MRHSLTREFGRQGHQGLCTDVWVAAGQQVSVDTEGSKVRLGHKAAEAHRPGGAGVSCTRQGHRRRQADTGRQPGTDHLALTSATVVSSIRLEKPHSLSYQLVTFTRRPLTLVRVLSKVEDAGLWLKSTETSG